LTGHFMQRWRREEVRPAGWLLYVGLSCWALVGVSLSLGLLVAGGGIEVSWLRHRILPGLEHGACLGMIPAFGAGIAWLCWHDRWRAGLLRALTLTAVVFVGSLAFWVGSALDAHKAPRFLVQTAQARQLYSEVRVGCYEYYQPSLVFYCQRQVQRLLFERDALNFLRSPLHVYLFMPAGIWDNLETKVTGPYRVVS